MTNRLRQGTIAIITGCSSGIGKAFALDLARRYKAKLVINARNLADLNDAAKEIEAAGAQVITVNGDISKPEVIDKVIATCKSSFGKVDILVNNAGFAKPGPMLALSPDDWRQVFEVNFFAPLALTLRAAS